MWKALIRKQMSELLSFFTIGRKSGKQRSRSGALGMAALYAFLLFSFGMIFLGVAETFSGLLTENDGADGWMYFAFLAVFAVVVSTFVTALTTSSFLFRAKDNDLLLSFPIPTVLLIASRTLPIVLMAAVYTGCVWFPTVLVFVKTTGVGLLGAIAPLLMYPVLVVLVVVLSCLFGWMITLILARAKNKNLPSIIGSLLFVAIYFGLYAYGDRMLTQMLRNVSAFSAVIRYGMFPIFALAKASIGSFLWSLIAILTAAALAALLFYVLSRTFVRIVAGPSGAKKTVYREKAAAARSVGLALLVREFRRLIGNATYLLNCCIGVLMMLVAAIVIPLKRDAAMAAIASLGAEAALLETLLPALMIALACFLTGMDADPACSISLEGKSLFIIQTLPVETKAILRAKIQMHLLINLPPALLLALSIGLTYGIGFLPLLLTIVCIIAAITAISYAELLFNLLNPNFNFMNIAAVVKQSAPVFYSVLCSFVTAAIPPVFAVSLHGALPTEATLAIITAFYVAAVVTLRRVIYTHGVKIWNRY